MDEDAGTLEPGDGHPDPAEAGGENADTRSETESPVAEDPRDDHPDEGTAGAGTPDHEEAADLPATVTATRSAPLDDGIVQALAAGAAPGAVIEQAANVVRLLCPERGVAVWYRHPDGTADVQAAGIGAHLIMITGDPESAFWQRARTETEPNYRITFHAHAEDTGPTSVWCVPLLEGPASGEVTLVAVGRDDGEAPTDDVRLGLEHVTRLVGVSVDRAELVARLERGRERPDGPPPQVEAGLTPTGGDSTEPAETVLLFVRLAQIHDFEMVHGHKAGLALSTEVGKRLSATIRPGDTVARLGTTDFALRCHPVTAIQAESIVARLLNNLWDPVVTRWEDTRLRPRVGMVRTTEATPLNELLGQAEMAMARADKVGRDWLWADQEIEVRPAELGPAPDPAGFGAGMPD